LRGVAPRLTGERLKFSSGQIDNALSHTDNIREVG
jgi:hypothetical protein